MCAGIPIVQIWLRRDESESLQYLMGYSEVATTMDVYTHFGYEETKAEVRKVSGNDLS